MKLNALTLIEIVIAMVILSLVLLGMTGVFITGKRYLKRAQYKQEALNFTRQKLEELEALDFNDSGLNAGTYAEILPNGWGITWKIIDQHLDSDTSPDRKNVTVAVHWQEQ